MTNYLNNFDEKEIIEYRLDVLNSITAIKQREKKKKFLFSEIHDVLKNLTDSLHQTFAVNFKAKIS